jgi:hypothetical protein
MARSVYEPLRHWLSSCGQDTVNLDFAEIEQILGRKLPPSAYRHDLWWHNENDSASTHTQSRLGWMAAGYVVRSVDRIDPCVIFIRQGR